MQYLGDYAEDYATLNFKFMSRTLAQVPATLSGTPAVSVYKANGTTQSTAGITLTVDFDGVTGLNNVLIDLSADAFYAVGNDYQVVITTGTVDSISVVGTVLAHFSIENRFNEVNVTAISGDSTAADNAEAFFDGTGYAGTNNVIPIVTSITNGVTVATNNDKTGYTASTVSDKTGYSLAASQTFNVTGNITGNLSGSVGSVTAGVTVTTNNDKTGYTASTVSDKTGYSLTVTPPTAAQVRAEIDSNSTQLAAIVADTAEIQAELADGGRTDLLIDGIKISTDNLATAMQLDGEVYRFTANALEEAPSSSGGDATAANQTIIINHLTGIKGATWSGTTDSLEAIRDRGDAAWVTGAGLSGANTVTLTIHDGDGANIVEAAVEVWDSAGTTFYERKSSNSSGQAVFSADDGTYTVKVHKAGFTFTDTTLTVSGNTAQTITGTAFNVGTPSSPSMCRVYTYINNLDGTHPTTCTATAQIKRLPHDDGTYLYGSSLTGVYNSTSGLLYFDIVRESVARIIINNYGVDHDVSVPDAVSVDILTLI